MSMQAAPVIEARRLSRTFAGPIPVHALREVDLTVQSGAFVTVVGPSGSGKSTLLQLLGLLDTPTSGSYRLGGRETAQLTEGARCGLRATAIGFVFQSFHLLDGRTARQNVELALLYRGVGARSAAERARGALERVGLGDRADQRVRTMSGGERQRVAIARAVVGGPHVVLCDEPTGSLDSTNSGLVMDLLVDLNRDGTTIIVITHDEAVASLGSQRLAIIDGVLR
ncbi:ABC transporter ATP-binding protein [Nocardioides dubius]|uniref:ABC transporter ATP-binding protein n=1 Tax=Nocardioides dubius TaxID=317019 RepID=A0ABN1TTQ4_9ACTN